jgi:hypothetical protein
MASTWARLGCLVLTLVAACGDAKATPPGSSSSRPVYEIIRVVRGHYNRITLNLVIDGVKGLTVVDTGAEATLLNTGTFGFLLKNGAKRPDNLPATAKMNENSLPLAVGRDVQLGAIHLHNVPLPLAPARFFHDAALPGSDASDRVYDGFLGENFLRHYNAVLDCARPALYLTIDPASKLNLDHALRQNGWTRTPMTNDGYDFTVLCTLKGHPYRLLVDTGCPFTSLNAAILSKEQIAQREIRAHSAVIGYLPDVVSVSTLDTLSIGDYTATKVPCMSTAGLGRQIPLQKTKPGDAPLAGLLGGDTLSNNNAIIDIGNHNLYLKHPGAGAPALP